MAFEKGRSRPCGFRLSEAIRFEPDFAAALTERGLVEERLNDLRRARADFTAVLKLPQTDSTSVWAHAKARERLAATEAAARAVANPNPTAATPSAGAPASDFWRRPLAQVLQECNAKPAVTVKLPGAKGTIELNRCYRGRDHPGRLGVAANWSSCFGGPSRQTCR